MKTRRFNSITDVEGIWLGHSTDLEGITGCTAILCPEGAVAAGEKRGAATGTREWAPLEPGHIVPLIHGLCLSGGSAFGLDAATGVVRFLEERGVGFDVMVTRVPIVPAAIIFDLKIGDYRVRPTAEMGYAAAAAAKRGKVAEGSVGAGTGATVGKLFGMLQATKGGVGTASVKLPDGPIVGALAVVNAFGDILEPSKGRIIAGARTTPRGWRFRDSAAHIKQNGRFAAYGNTTLGVVATDAALDSMGAGRMARLAMNGMIRALSPASTIVDGDLVVAMSTGKHRTDDPERIGLAAEEALIKAMGNAVRKARGLGGVPGLADR